MAQKTQNFSETFVVFFMKLKTSSLHSTRSNLFRVKMILSILDPSSRNQLSLVKLDINFILFCRVYQSFHIIFEIATGISSFPTSASMIQYFWANQKNRPATSDSGVFFFYIYDKSLTDFCVASQYFSCYRAFIIIFAIVILLSSMANNIISVCYLILVKKVVFISLHQSNCVHVFLHSSSISYFFFIFEFLINSVLHGQDLYHEDMRSFDHLSILSVSLLFLGHLLWHSNWISCLVLDLWSKNYFLIDPSNSTFIGPAFFFSYGQWSFDFMVTCVKSFLNIPSQVCRDSDVIQTVNVLVCMQNILVVFPYICFAKSYNIRT